MLHVYTQHNTDTAIFQDDNCRVHRAKSVHELLSEHNRILRHFDWPEKSTQFNTIGNYVGLFGIANETSVGSKNSS